MSGSAEEVAAVASAVSATAIQAKGCEKWFANLAMVHHGKLNVSAALSTIGICTELGDPRGA